MQKLQLDQEFFKFVTEHIDDDPYDLVLHAKQYPEIDVELAAKQIELRKKLKQKLPEWYDSGKPLFFDSKLALEQCSSGPTAQYKQQFVPSGGKVVDLTLGMGVDAYYLAQKAEVYRGYELDELRAEMTRNNLSLLGSSVEVLTGNGTETSFEGIDLLYVDPARRGAMNRKVFVLEDCQPNILEYVASWLKQVPLILIKLSPMIDLQQVIRQLIHVKEIHCVSVSNEMKEVLVLLDRDFEGEPKIIASELNEEDQFTNSFFFSAEHEQILDYSDGVGAFLYEPFSSYLKSGMYKSLCLFFPVDKLAEHSHLYTSSSCVENFPGRVFRVTDVIPFSSKWCKREADQIKKANVAVRNFPISVQEFRKKTGIKEGGDRYIFLTTLKNGDKVIVIGQKNKESLQ